MRNWKYAAGRFIPTLWGLVRVGVRAPRRAVRILCASLFYALTGRMPFTVVVEEGYPIAHPKELVAYLAHFIEGEIEAAAWLTPYRQAAAPVCLDVGGHAGIFSLRLLCENPSALVLAFEPQPSLAAKAIVGLSAVGERYRCYPLAISDQAGKARLYCDDMDNSQASLESDWRNGPHAIVEVETRTLDEAAAGLEAIFLVKIDVEGHEVSVLKGGPAALGKTRFVLAEILSRDNLQSCRALLGPGWRETKIGRGDYLFESMR